MRVAFLALAAALVLSGCLKVDVGGPAPSATPSGSVSAYRVACQLVDENRTSLRVGTCVFQFGALSATVNVDRNGTAARTVPAGLAGTVTGAAPGRGSLRSAFTVDGPKSVRMVLPRLVAGASGTGTPPGPGPSPLAERTWLAPVAVLSDASGAEPQVFVAPDGTIYYAPASRLYRSTDGGKSFAEITPGLPDALPIIASDDSVSIAPDGTLWYTAYWGYPDSTLGCTSTDRGTSWTCNNFAVPGITDRMWVAGLSATEGYVMANQGTEYHVWSHTTDGSTTYLPYATSSGTTVRNGPMVYDAVHHKVWQVEFTGGTIRLIRVDGATALVSYQTTDVPAPYALPWLAAQDGVLWTTGERGGQVYAARSTDEGKTWQHFQVSSQPKEATFSYIAAGANGRAAVVYYGSDKAGDSTSNGGQWSLYVSETDDALDAHPTWVETRVVEDIHHGNLCVGLNCEQSGGDTNARMAGDLIGIAIDADGNAHVSYVRQSGSNFPNQYLRQVRASASG